ncbi:MAG: hypothetical protein K2N22_03990, partial [Clostridia bacterium]|nr:hypothetical protein [Clostridia bacterium]
TVRTKNGEIEYSMTKNEVVEITNKMVGYVNYKDGVNLNWGVTGGATSGHFVAFSCDRPIDKLMQAEVYFHEREVTYNTCVNPAHFGAHGGLNSVYNYQLGKKSEHEPIEVNYSEKASNQGGGNIVTSNKYSWDRIQTAEEFISDQNNKEYKLTYNSVLNLSDMQWVLNFYETPIQAKGGDGIWLTLVSPWALPFADDCTTRFTQVSDVMILRLKFEEDGEVYNLGVVDNKQSGADKPINEPIKKDDFWTWLLNQIKTMPWWAWLIIGLVAFSIVCTILSFVFPSFRAVVKIVGNGLYSLLLVITSPFRWLIRKINGD